MLKVYVTPATENGFTTLQADYESWDAIHRSNEQLAFAAKRAIRAGIISASQGDIVRIRFTDREADAVLALARKL